MKVKYKEIKSSYKDIEEFLTRNTFKKSINLKTKIEEDTYIAGDDIYFMMEKFFKIYNVKHDNFEFSKYFLTESEILHPLKTLFFILLSPLFFIIWIFRKFYPKAVLKSLNTTNKSYRKTLDLTFGDLLASKLKGEFCLRKNIEIQLKR